MNADFNFKTLNEFTEFFRDEETCVKHFTAIRFANGEYCPHCKHTKIYKFSNGKRYRCAACKEDFTIKTGTIFGESKLPLKKWFTAIYLLTSSRKGISSVDLAQRVGVTQKTGWFMDHRIREAMQKNNGQLFGTIESDECYVGGLAKNMHAKVRKQKITGTAGTDKIAVVGLRTRDGEVRAQVTDSTGIASLHPILKENIAEGSTLYTDEWFGYNRLEKFFKRGIIHHSHKEYVNGDVHTNGIESFWALFKRGYHGTYHHMSRKHLQRYVNEFAFRVSRRKEVVKDVFSEVVKNISNTKNLTYNRLIEKAA